MQYSCFKEQSKHFPYVFRMKAGAGPAALRTAVSFAAAARQLLAAGPVSEGAGRAGRRHCGRRVLLRLAPWRARAGGPSPRPPRNPTRAAALPRRAWAGGRSRHPATPWGCCRRRTARRAPGAALAAGHGRAAPAGKAS